MNRSLFIERRQKLLARCEDGSVVLLFANSDTGNQFIQNNNFYYFTGLNIPEAILMISKHSGKLHEKLFIERTIPERIVWDGEKMKPEEAKSISGVENVLYLDRFENELTPLLANNNYVLTKRLIVEGAYLSPHDSLNKSLSLVKKIKDRYPALCIDCLSNIIIPMRKKKDKWEVEQLRKAINLTKQGLDRVLNCKIAGKYEYQLEALIYFEIMNQGERNWAFKPIVAGGKNATILHYNSNNEKISPHDMVLFDVGALYNNYSADISRTYPAGKKYSKRQRAVYQEVLEVQKAVINLVEPGISLKNLNNKTVEMLTESLFKLKLIKDKQEVRKYYMHSVSHFLGMQAHDVSSRDAILEPGNVITVEPGLYIPEENIGVRIEDDILITGRGAEVLSASIPKEIEEIEELRAKALEK